MKNIQDLFSLLEWQTPMENGINSDAVECIFDYTIGLPLVSNASTSILFQLILEGGILKIYGDIIVPRIKGVKTKKCVIWNAFLGTRWSGIGRERAD